jgi:hypothetical protein
MDEDMKRYAAALTDAIERPWRERALAAEARVRDLEDTVGELLGHIEPGTCPACGAFYAWCW